MIAMREMNCRPHRGLCMLSSCPKSGDGSFDPLAITLPQGWLTAQGTGSDWPVRVSLRGATMTSFVNWRKHVTQHALVTRFIRSTAPLIKECLPFPGTGSSRRLRQCGLWILYVKVGLTPIKPTDVDYSATQERNRLATLLRRFAFVS